MEISGIADTPENTPKTGGLKSYIKGEESFTSESSIRPKSYRSKRSDRNGTSEAEGEARPKSFTGASQIEKILRALEGSFSSPTPANQILCLTPGRFDADASGNPPNDKILRRVVSDALRYHNTPSPLIVGMAENPAEGGRGLHRHLALHIPAENYTAASATLRSRLAKRCKTKLQALAKSKGVPFKTRDTADALYLRLIPVCPNDLPFMIEGSSPLSQTLMIQKAQRYFGKSVDPDFQVGTDKSGNSIPISRYDGLPMGCRLEAQSSKRPSNPVCLTRSARAMSRTDAAQSDPDIIANTLIERRRFAKLARSIQEQIKAVRPKEYAPEDVKSSGKLPIVL